MLNLPSKWSWTERGQGNGGHCPSSLCFFKIYAFIYVGPSKNFVFSNFCLKKTYFLIQSLQMILTICLIVIWLEMTDACAGYSSPLTLYIKWTSCRPIVSLLQLIFELIPLVWTDDWNFNADSWFYRNWVVLTQELMNMISTTNNIKQSDVSTFNT